MRQPSRLLPHLAAAYSMSFARAVRVGGRRMLFGVCLLSLAVSAPFFPAFAQTSFTQEAGVEVAPDAPVALQSKIVAPAKPAPERMFVEARQLIQDGNSNKVIALGAVQILYKGRTLEADKVVYDRKSNRVYAEGAAKLTEANGQTTVAERFELTDDLKEGFIDSLRVETPQHTYLSSPRGEREGDITVFDRGTYTACKPCEEAERPPLWRVRAKRIIHDNEDKTVYYEDARLEFLGVPLAYVPFFSAPDPSVKRRSGLLAPTLVTKSQLGFGAGIPIFWAVAPNIDLTVTPTFMSKQGVMGEIDWRHRLENGTYRIKFDGIRQLRPSQFSAPPVGAGDRKFRWSLSSSGDFALSNKWKFGWDVIGLSDRYFLQDYTLNNPLFGNYYFREASSTVYLTGKSERAWFDLRGFVFQSLTARDFQPQLPKAPVLEFNRTFPISPAKSAGIGGEFELDANVSYVTAQAALYESIQPRLFDSAYGLINVCQNYAPAANPRDSRCLLRGIGGDYARATIQGSWKRTFIDPIGQTWTPFLFLRGGGTYLNYDKNRVYGVYNQFIQPLYNGMQVNFVGSDDVMRGQITPGGGLEYRYPMFAQLNVGTLTFEPIAQIIARPNGIGNRSLVNIDSQSLVFDDSSLFNWSKYSGYDRYETGTRLNYGGQATFRFKNGAFINVMAGQSYQVAGVNGYNSVDAANVGLSSGLEKRRSDYVGRVTLGYNDTFSLVGKARFDAGTMEARRIDLVAAAKFGSLAATAQYANYAAQAPLGFDKRRQGLAFTGRYDITQNYFATGNVQFDMSRYLYNGYNPITNTYGKASLFSIAGLGLGGGYQDECTTFLVNYTSVYQLNSWSGIPGRNQTIMFSLQLRTLAEAKAGASLGFLPVNDGVKSVP